MIFKILSTTLLLSCFLLVGKPAFAQNKTSWSIFSAYTQDQDQDGILDWKETHLYKTSPYQVDSDGDGTNDYQELLTSTDPNDPNNLLKLQKHIYVSLRNQELRYYTGPYLMDDFSVSTGVPGKDTPTGEFSVLRKVPLVLYQGIDYYYPNTKWNLNFKPGYYLHGAFWHSNFGKKMSHGCVNISYQDVKPLYDWADVATPVTIVAGDFPTDQAHIDGSWILNSGTVYYVLGANLIPIPSWEIFLSNGGQAKYIIKASEADMSKPMLELMIPLDGRVAH